MTFKQAIEEIKRRNMQDILQDTLASNPTKTTREVLSSLLGAKIVGVKNTSKKVLTKWRGM